MNAHVSSLPAPRSFGAWLLAARPATLPVAVAPVLVGAAAALGAGGVRLGPTLGALFGALMIQVGTNFANDVFDAEKGVDDERRIGPPRAVSKGLLGAGEVKLGMIAAFGLATLAGLYLTWVAGWVIVLIGVLSILSGIAYTGGPYPLGYNGLGDVFVFVFFGLVAVTGTAFVACGAIPPVAWVSGAAVGALATNVLVVNNTRDAEGDRRSGKRTLVARFGRRFGVIEYAAWLLVAAASIVASAWLTRPVVLLSLAPLLVGAPLWRTISRSSDGPTLNRLLAQSAKLMLVVSLFLAVTLGLAARL